MAQSRPLAVNVTITQSAILVEGDGVTTVRAGAVDPSVKRDGANGYYIPPLVDIMTKHANRTKKIAAMGGTQFDGTAMVLVDKNTPYRLLTEVLYSGRAGGIQELSSGRHSSPRAVVKPPRKHDPTINGPAL